MPKVPKVFKIFFLPTLVSLSGMVETPRPIGEGCSVHLRHFNLNPLAKDGSKGWLTAKR
jgi:hypothetical protein